MATLDLHHQMQPKLNNVCHNDRTLRGQRGRAFCNAKDPPGVAAFPAKASCSTQHPTDHNPAQALHATVPATPLLPFVAQANVLPDAFPVKFNIAPAHSADVEMNALPDPDDDMVDADPDALDDVKMPHIAISNVPIGLAQREPLHNPAHAADVNMADPNVDALTAMLAEWYPFRDSVPVVTTHLALWMPFDPVTRDKRIRSHTKQKGRPAKRCKVTHPAYRRSPWSTSHFTTSGKLRRRALRLIKRTSPPITTTATPTTTGFNTPTSAATSVSTPTSTTLFDSATSTLVEFDTPKHNTAMVYTSPKANDIDVDDSGEGMEIDIPTDNDYVRGDTSEDMDIDLLEDEDSIMDDASQDMDIDMPEDIDIVMLDAWNDMEIDIHEDIDILMGDVSEDMDID